MVVSLMSRNLCRRYLYEIRGGLALVRESVSVKCRCNLSSGGAGGMHTSR
jgi:hypothetical protein